MNKANRVHNKETSLHALHPKIVSLDDVLMSTAEANIFSTPSGIIARQPDNLYFCKNHVLIADEYKCSDHQYNKAMKQLKDYKMYLNDIFPNWQVVVRYVYCDNNIEVIR
jgi:hypothetical protein